MVSKYLLTTFGCKVNQYESQQIREVVESLGLRRVRQGEVPDIAIVNTCAVTSNASRKNRQAIRRLSRRGCTQVFVVGCGATADSNQLNSLDGVAAVLGHDTDVCTELRGLIESLLCLNNPLSYFNSIPVHQRSNVHKDEVWMIPDTPMPSHRDSTIRTPLEPIKIISTSLPIVKEQESLVTSIGHFSGHQRAFLKVQDGCDAFCTYCIIPQLRPKLRSKPIEIAVSEAKSLVQNGHKEIIITGIFLGAYGRDTAIRKRFSRKSPPLARLVEALSRVEGLERLRISSLEPGDVDETFLGVLAESQTCVPHLHLPLQSGSESILRKMNRQYDRAQFYEMIDRVNSMLDRPAISTDIIVGFPGETDADFEDSLQVARDVGFCKIHAFPFSPRQRTAAARWQKEFVHPTIVRERMHRLAEVEKKSSLAFRQQFVGEVERVIVERSSNENKIDGFDACIYHGRADRYFEIHFEADENVRAGDLVSLRIDRVTPTRTHGAMINSETNQTNDYPLHVISNYEHLKN